MAGKRNNNGASAPKKISDAMREALRNLGIKEEVISSRKKKQIGNNGRPIEDTVIFTGDIKLITEDTEYPYYVCLVEGDSNPPSLKSIMGLTSTVGCLNEGETAVNEYYKNKNDSETIKEKLTATADINKYEPFKFPTRNLDDLADMIEEDPSILKGKKGTYLGITLKTHISKKEYPFSNTYIKPGIQRVTETKLWLIE